MSVEISLFEINPALDRATLADEFAINRRVQVRDILTEAAAATIHQVLAAGTPWGLAWQANDGPSALRPDEMAGLSAEQRQAMGRAIMQNAGAGRYSFAYHRYPMVEAYTKRWRPDGPHDLLLEHINDQPMIDFVREVTGFANLVKADAQATLFAPGQFLGLHHDSHVDEGWKVAYVLNFARDWHEDWGGYLLFYDEDGDVIAGYKPRFNALNMFAVPQRHSVTYVPPFSPVGRFAITGWFRDR